MSVLADAAEPHPHRGSRQGGVPILAAVLLLAGALAGCVDAVEDYNAFDADKEYKNPGVFPGDYAFASDGSTVLRPGLLEAGDPEVIRLRSDLPAYVSPVGESTTDGTVLITMAVWRPTNITTPVPVIIDAGPYFEIGAHCPVRGQDPCRQPLVNDTIDWASQTTPFSLKNFLPYGYAVAQVAVRGTGTAGGCMDLLGPSEVHDLNQAINWLGEQPWSNGNVAMWGVSYDGSTPWEVAATGNPHLKTIIPISGLPDIYDLMFHNGSAESRGPLMHGPLVYWSYGWSDDFLQPPPLPIPLPPEVPPLPSAPQIGQANGREDYQDMQNLLCPEAFEGNGMGVATTVTGDRLSAVSNYWVERDHRDDVLANYTGSIFLVHGLQDWNVDPHSAIPFNAALRAKGIEMKEWYGQWDHARPDSRCAKSMPEWVTLPCRLDFADVMLRWFERQLKGNLTIDVGPSVQVQDNVGFWRNAESFPPTDPQWLDLHLTGERTLSSDASAELAVDLMPGTPLEAGTFIELKSEPMAEDLHLSGLPQLRIPFEARGPGGQLAAWLFDEDEQGNVRAPYAGYDPENREWVAYGDPVIGHAQMNLRYHDGGETAQLLVPGTRYTAEMELEPLEVLVPKGHRLTLWVFQGQYPDHWPTGTPSPLRIFLGGDAVLRLPVVDVDATTVFPVPGVHLPQRDLLERMSVPKPFGPFTSVLPPSPVGVGDAGVCGSGVAASVPAVVAAAAWAGAPVPRACPPMRS